MYFDVEEVVDYAKAILPIVVAHVVVPPLVYFDPFSAKELSPLVQDSFSTLYKILPSQLLQKKYVYSLLLDDSNVLDQPYRWITHMFAHVTYSHLFSNLESTVMLGFPAYREFGPGGMILFYVVGGVCAAIPKKLLKQLQISRREVKPMLKDFPTVSSYVDKFTSALSSKSFSCGSSGAVCALLGCSFISTIGDLVHIAKKLWANRYSNSKSKEDKKNKLRSSKVSTLELFSTLTNAYTISSYIVGEYHKLQLQQATIPGGLTDNLMSLFNTKSIVDHSAHIQGFLFGISITAGFRLYQQYYSKSSKRRYV